MEPGYSDDFQSASIGGRLQEAREARGLSLEELASQTRIPVRHLQHIEREEWDALPAVTYCVGFVRAYANAVGLDGAEFGREIRDRLGGTRSRAPAPEYYQPADPARVPPRSLALIAAVIGIVLVIGYVVWRNSLAGEEESAEVTVPVAEAPAPAATQPGPAVQPAPPPAGGQVSLVATEEVWLQIEDQASGGPSLFQGTLVPGQNFVIPATAQRPVVRTGRPQVLRVSVGGRDLGPLEPSERTVSDVSLRAEDVIARSQGGAAATPPAPALPAPVPPQ